MLYVVRWFVKKLVVICNSLILVVIVLLKKVDIDGLDGIKKVLNVMFDLMVLLGFIVMIN